MSRWPYTTKQWRFTRAAKLSASPWCEHCGKPANQVDHIVAVAAGCDPFDPKNLQSLCQGCHSEKTASENGGFGNRRGKARRKGCRLDGTPLDPQHWWNMEAKNLPDCGPEDRANKREES